MNQAPTPHGGFKSVRRNARMNENDLSYLYDHSHDQKRLQGGSVEKLHHLALPVLLHMFSALSIKN